MDWKTHFSAISPLAALPILMLVPAAAMLFAGRARRINRSLEIVSLLWMLGFSYALVVAFLAGHLFGGVYTFVQFCLPLGFGLWLATRSEDADIWYRRISETMIVLAFISGVYGIIQYTVLPPWDSAWMTSVSMDSNGAALPFEVRVFSTLNSPGTFAAFLTVATIMFLPRLTLRSGLLLVPIFIGLGLTMVRAGWVTLLFCIVVFALLTTRRTQLLKGVATFIGIGVLTIALSPLFFTAGIGTNLQNRLSSLSSIGSDASAADRAGQMADAFRFGIGDPEGAGLGFVGVGTRLDSAQATASNLDSGYLSRFVEMGVPGTIAFLASLGFALSAAGGVWKTAVRNGDTQMQDRAALAITMQVALLALNLFGDASMGFPAILAWTTLGLVLRGPAPKRILQ